MCECECGGIPKEGNRFIHGHNCRVLETRKKIALTVKKNHENNPNYGMNNKHHTKEVKHKLSEMRKGEKSPLYRKDITKEKVFRAIEEIVNEHGKNIGKRKLRDTLLKRLKCAWWTVYSRCGRLDDILEKLDMKVVAKRKFGINEKQILDEYENRIGVTVERQKYVAGFYVDGYIKKTNTAIEVDEKYHYINDKLRVEDIIRENKIKDKLKCSILRIKDFGRENKNIGDFQ